MGEVQRTIGAARIFSFGVAQAPVDGFVPGMVSTGTGKLNTERSFPSSWDYRKEARDGNKEAPGETDQERTQAPLRE